MAKETTTKTAPAAATEAEGEPTGGATLEQEAPAAEKPADDQPTEFPLTVAEFCARLSSTDRRVEMIGAFHAFEKAAGRIKDVESAYRARYADFCNAPA